MFWARCLRLFRVYFCVSVQYRALEPGVDERHRFGRHSASPADGRGTVWTWRCLSSLLRTLAKMTWVFISVKRFGSPSFTQNMASSGNIPFSTFSGLLESFQVEDSHLLNHGKTLALLWMSFIQACWPSLTLFRLRSNEPMIQGGVAALSRLCK